MVCCGWSVFAVYFGCCDGKVTLSSRIWRLLLHPCRHGAATVMFHKQMVCVCAERTLNVELSYQHLEIIIFLRKTNTRIQFTA